MSIKIVAQEQLEQQQADNSIMSKVPLLFYPAPKLLYANRYARLQSLAKDSPFADYLNLCAAISKKQADLNKNKPLDVDLSDVINSATKNNHPPLSLENYPLNAKWIDYLLPILESVAGINAQIDHTISQLKLDGQQALLNKATLLLQGQFDQVDSNQSLFIWAALSVYYTQLASHLPNNKALADMGGQRWFCPVCNNAPAASVIHIGENVGARYLHCSLCETEWNVPRVQCTSCDNLENIQYFSLGKEHSAIKTECCSKCNGYLKIFNQDLDPHLEIIADDIASLVLDMKTEEEGFAKTGINPFLFSIA